MSAKNKAFSHLGIAAKEVEAALRFRKESK